MKKPVHGFALTLLVVAPALFVIEMIVIITRPNTVGAQQYWFLFRNAAIPSLQLGALGLLIEIADQIRWRGLAEEVRARRLSKPSLLSTARDWPRKPDGNPEIRTPDEPS